MTFRADYLQAFRELRANGRIGYSVLNNPRARMAASEVLRMRLDCDDLWVFRREFAYSLGWVLMAGNPAAKRPEPQGMEP